MDSGPSLSEVQQEIQKSYAFCVMTKKKLR